MKLIHPSAQVSPAATLGDDVQIGPFCVVHANVVLGDRVVVGAYCELGVATLLGGGTLANGQGTGAGDATTAPPLSALAGALRDRRGSNLPKGAGKTSAGAQSNGKPRAGGRA